MRLNKYLTEKWKKSFKMILTTLPDGIVEVFVNPTKREFQEVKGINQWQDHIKDQFVRFYADIEKREVHIWNPEVIHVWVWKQIGDSRPYNDGTLITGVAENKGGKWTFTESDEGVQRNLIDYSWEDWQWADKWINVSDTLKNWKKRIGH
jgi:hypothetical protein